MTAFPILNVQHLTKTYATSAGQLTVLKDISFILPQSSTCSILGPSGSGKTTLLGLCAGLDRPTSGFVLLNGITLGEAGEDERARIRNEHVGFVFQNFQLIPTLTALENVMVPMELRGDRSARTLGLDLLGRVGLGERVEHYPAQLSGGEAVSEKNQCLRRGRRRGRRRDLGENCARKKAEGERNSANCWHRFPHARRIMFA